jgi:hypothetical protein
MTSGESDVQTIFETLLTTSSPPNQPPDFLKPPALLGVNLRAGPVGSVWGLAPGRVGALGSLPMTLLAQPCGTERSRGVRWRPREEV